MICQVSSRTVFTAFTCCVRGDSYMAAQIDLRLVIGACMNVCSLMQACMESCLQLGALHAGHASVRVAGCCLQGRGVYVLQDAACMAGERTCNKMLLAGQVVCVLQDAACRVGECTCCRILHAWQGACVLQDAACRAGGVGACRVWECTCCRMRHAWQDAATKRQTDRCV